MKLDIDPTKDERQSLCAEIHRRNFVRKKAQLPLIEVSETYTRELALIRAARFRRILQPYITKALSELPSAYGWLGRLGRRLRAQRIASERLINDYDCDLGDLPVPSSVRQQLPEELGTRNRP